MAIKCILRHRELSKFISSSKISFETRVRQEISRIFSPEQNKTFFFHVQTHYFNTTKKKTKSHHPEPTRTRANMITEDLPNLPMFFLGFHPKFHGEIMNQQEISSNDTSCLDIPTFLIKKNLYKRRIRSQRESV